MSNRSQAASPPVVLAIACVAVVLASLDLFIVNVALPDLASDFGETGLGDLSWVLNGYAITYAALLVLFGRLADRYPREQGFLLGLGVFILGSALCAVAQDTLVLVLFRILQAAGAALLTPTSLGLVLATAPPEKRQTYVRTWTAVGGLAAALGPVIGGVLVEASWRWVFLVNVPIGLAALAYGFKRLPNVPGHPVPVPDLLGAVYITGGVALLTLGLVEGHSWGWGSGRVVGVLVAAAVLLVAFGRHTAHHRNPLVDRELLKVREFTSASVVAAVISASFGAMLLSVVLWDQDVWGWSALRTGLAVAPGPIMVPFVGLLLTGKLVGRFGSGKVIAAGSLFFASGTAWWALGTTLEPNYVTGMLGGAIITGIGVGLFLPAVMAGATAALPPASMATGSAVVNMMRQVGLALGVAIFVAVLGTPGSPAASVDAFQRGWWVLTGISVLAAALSLGLLAVRPRQASASASAQAAGVASAAHALSSGSTRAVGESGSTV